MNNTKRYLQLAFTPVLKGHGFKMAGVSEKGNKKSYICLFYNDQILYREEIPNGVDIKKMYDNTYISVYKKIFSVGLHTIKTINKNGLPNQGTINQGRKDNKRSKVQSKKQTK
jgi:hypothetical protein